MVTDSLFPPQSSFDEVITALDIKKDPPQKEKKKPIRTTLVLFLFTAGASCLIFFGILYYQNMQVTSSSIPKSTAIPLRTSLLLHRERNISPPTCTLATYRDEFSNTSGGYTLLQVQSHFAPNEIVVFAVNVANMSQQPVTFSLKTILSEKEWENVDFLDTNCGPTAFNALENSITCPSQTLSDGQFAAPNALIFRAQVQKNMKGSATLKPSVTLTSPSMTASCSSTVTIGKVLPPPSPSPKL